MLRKTILHLEWLDDRVLPAGLEPPTWIPLAAPTVVATRAPATWAPSVPKPSALAAVAAPISTTIVPPPVQSAPPPIAVASPRSALAGTVQGSYTSTLLLLTTPSGFHMSGAATLGHLGPVDFYAHIYSVGFRTVGHARGEITLSNSRGSLTLELIGPEQTRLAPLPDSFDYRVISGTGEFKNLRESGSLRLTRLIDAIPVRNGIRYVETGSFRLTI